MSKTKSNSQNVEKKLNKKEYNFDKSVIKVYDFFENSNENKEYKLKYILDIKKICREIGINFDKSCEAKRVIFYKNNYLARLLLQNPDFITQFCIKNVEKKLNKKEYNLDKSLIKVCDFFENSNENKEYKLEYILDIKKICGEIGINFDKSWEAKRIIFYENNCLARLLLRNPDFITQLYIKNEDLKTQQKKEPTLRIGSESLGNSTEYLSVLVMTGCLWLTCIALYGKNILDR